MVCALVYMVTHWMVLIVNHDISYQGIMIHQANMLHGLSTLREYRASIEVISGFHLCMRL